MSNPEWLPLFNTGERDHVVDLLLGGDEAIRHSLPVTLIPMIDAYCRDNEKGQSAIDIEAAQAFRVAVFEVCRQIDPEERERFWTKVIEHKRAQNWEDDPDRAQNWEDDPDFVKFVYAQATHINWEKVAEKLRVAWTDFIAAGSAYLQYNEKPKQREARASGSQKRGENKKAWKTDAIKEFDPGPDAGSKLHRARIIRKRAIEAGFRDAEKLPKRLDRDFPD